jgi:hypothetical protein
VSSFLRDNDALQLEITTISITVVNKDGKKQLKDERMEFEREREEMIPEQLAYIDLQQRGVQRATELRD